MKKLFLASQIDFVAAHIVRQFTTSPGTLRAAFITTAAEAEKGERKWLDNDRQGLMQSGLDVFNYTVTGKSPAQLVEDLSHVDVLHVNGGNTFYLLLQARKSGFDVFVKEFVEKEKIYIGSSAGSIVAAPNIEISKTNTKEDFADELQTFEGFHLVDFMILPHWGKNNEHAESRKERVLKTFTEKNKIILLNDYQYVQVEDDMYKIVDVRVD